MAHARALVVLGMLVLAGCSQTTTGTTGALGLTDAATAGDVAGSTILSGGVMANVAGRDLDATARRKAQEAEYQALEFGRTGSPTTWKSGSAHGEVVPGAPYQVNAYNCRDYTHRIYGPGQPQNARGTACRQANGRWQPVS